MKIAIVTNIPTPYRIPVYSELNKLYQIDLLVIFFAHTEPNRHWDKQRLDFKHKFFTWKG